MFSFHFRTLNESKITSGTTIIFEPQPLPRSNQILLRIVIVDNGKLIEDNKNNNNSDQDSFENDFLIIFDLSLSLFDCKQIIANRIGKE